MSWKPSKIFQEKYDQWAGEMAQQVKTLAALPQDLGSVASTTLWLTLSITPV